MLLTSTGAQSLILEHADVARVMEARAGRPLLVIDIAVPRDVDPSAADLDGVTLLDMDDLHRFAATLGRRPPARGRAGQGRSSPKRSSATAARPRAREAAPLVASLRDRAEVVRAGRARPGRRPARRARRA